MQSDVLEDASLDDGKKRLRMSVQRSAAFEFVFASRRPRDREFVGTPGILMRTRVGWALVQHHADVGTEFTLNLHDVFRTEKMPGTVDVRLKLDAVVRQFTKLG